MNQVSRWSGSLDSRSLASPWSSPQYLFSHTILFYTLYSLLTRSSSHDTRSHRARLFQRSWQRIRRRRRRPNVLVYDGKLFNCITLLPRIFTRNLLATLPWQWSSSKLWFNTLLHRSTSSTGSSFRKHLECLFCSLDFVELTQLPARDFQLDVVWYKILVANLGSL